MKGRYLQSIRAYVREDFRETCAYCLLTEYWASGVEAFEIDHFRPKSRFPHLARHFYNLYWSCHVCNKFKSDYWPSPQALALGVEFVDLCQANFADHFVEQPSGNWEAKTRSA